MARVSAGNGDRFRPETSKWAVPAGSAAAAAVVGIAVGALRARHASPYRPVLERLALPLPAEHAALAGLRIGFLTDLHVGPTISAGDVARGIHLLLPEQPDLFLLGGDYLSDSPRYAERAAAALGDLARAAPLGAFAVLGNHDLANDARRVTRALETRGIVVLRNRAAAVDAGRGILWIVGIDDATLGAPDPDAAFRDVPPGAAALALWHEPDDAERAAVRGAFAQLSGHSHGGQVKLPIVGAAFAPAGGRKRPGGLGDALGMPVYTSRGLGVYRPPLRFNCPPEVTLVTLTAPAS